MNLTKAVRVTDSYRVSNFPLPGIPRWHEITGHNRRIDDRTFESLLAFLHDFLELGGVDVLLETLDLAVVHLP